MNDIKPGTVYYSHRTDIEPSKKKYQLYFDEKLVLLINTKRSKYNMSIFWNKKNVHFWNMIAIFP